MRSIPSALGFVGLLSTLSLFTSEASAQAAFHSSGRVSLAMERVFGIHYAHNEFEEPGGAEYVDSSTVIGLGWYGALTPVHWARIALDGFITDRLSLGGSLGFFSQSGDAEGDGVLFSPRIGYAIPISRVFAFWPRGGVTYIKMGSDSLFGITGEAMFVASPKPSWGILFGPTLDFQFVGDRGPNKWRQYSIGFPTVGILGTF